ncbi:MAG: M24 family metallopeptidase [Lachnospiraceae bacterium]
MIEQRNRRIKKLEQLLTDHHADAILIYDTCNVQYFSGFTGGDAILLIIGQKQCILSDSRYTLQIQQEAPDFTFVERSGTSYEEAAAQLLSDFQCHCCLYEDTVITAAQYQRLLSLRPNSEWVPVENRLQTIRMVKDETELSLIRRAEEIGDLAFSYMLKTIKAGITEQEIALELEYQMRKSGAQGLSFDTIVASGVNGAMPHAKPGNKQILNGELITMDFGCVYQGYCSDMTRTICVGFPSAEQKKIYDTVLQAQLLALDQICAGQKASEPDKVARDYIQSQGYGEYFGHALGHGVGLYIHEAPSFSPKCDTVIEENMVMSVEPGIYVPNFCGVRIEDLIVIKKDGYENLSHSTKEFIQI